jgi:hypothetical protein
MDEKQQFDDQLDCRVCHAAGGGSITIPIPTSRYTDIQWAVCPTCGGCYPKEEDYHDAVLHYRTQIKAVVEEMRKHGAPQVVTTLGNREDFLTWYLGDLAILKSIIKKQARAIRRLLKQS